MRLKVLPLKEWMKYPAMCIRNCEEWPEFETDRTDIDARYCHGEVAWFIVDGMVYKDDVDDFNFALAIENTKLFRECEYEWLRQLRSAGVLNKKAWQELAEFEYWMELRSIRRNVRKSMLYHKNRHKERKSAET